MSPDDRHRRSGGYGGGRGSSRGGGGSDITPAPPVKFFIDPQKEEINPELLDAIAEKQADEVHGKINSAQVRRFFGEVKSLSGRLQHQEPFERLLPLIKMIKSKTWYASSRNKIPREFASFMLGGISQVKDQKDFEAFVLYFEAVVGFMYGKGLVTK